MSKKQNLLIIISILITLSVIIYYLNLNTELFLIINNFAQILPQFFWSNLTFLANTMLAMSLVLIVASKQEKLFASALLLLIIGMVFTHSAKKLFDEVRPAAILDLNSFTIIGPELTKLSFPSGHSFTALACWTLIALALPKKWFFPTFIIACFAALSRISVGAHWPIDVLVGSLCGICIAWFSFYIIDYFKFLKHPYIIFFSALLLTSTAIYIPFFESVYPSTDILAIIISVVATLFAFKNFWIPKIKLFIKK